MSHLFEALWRRLSPALGRSMAIRLGLVTIVTLCVLAIGGVIAHDQFNRQLKRFLIDPEIAGVADNLIANAGAAPDGSLQLLSPPYDPRYLEPTSGRYFQIASVQPDNSLGVQIASRSLFDVTIALSVDQRSALVAPNSGAHYFDISSGPDGGALRAIGQVAQIPGVEGRYLFLVAASPREIIEPAANLAGLAFAAFVFFCALMVLGASILQMHFGLEPLAALRRDVEHVRKGQAELLSETYPVELQPLAQELNALLSHNREVVERARRHVGNLAHALKTPIAVLKNASNEGSGNGEVVRQSIEEMESFVERQLRRARVAARAEAAAGGLAIGYRTPVLQNLQDLVFMMEQKYDHEKALDIVVEAEGDVTFRGEREDLLEMVANLLDNACKYGKSRIAVRLLPRLDDDGRLEIVVEDDGPGMSEEQITRAMERGARLDEATPGQGLGLSILQETVGLYAGDLVFERGQLGGLKARLRLPATD